MMTRGSIRSRSHVRLLVCLLALMSVLFGIGLSAVGARPAVAATGFTGAFLDSESLDFVGDGGHYSFSNVSLDGSANGFLSFTLTNATDTFMVSFQSSAGQPIVPGTYEGAQEIGNRDPGHPGMLVAGHGHGCNTSAGRFVVDDATYNGAGNLLTFSVRFETHCQSDPTSALFGELSYNSTSPFRSRIVSADPLNFTSLAGAPITQSLTITNNGPASDDPTQIKLSGSDVSQFTITGSTCTAPLASGSSCSVTIRFNPTVPHGDGISPTFLHRRTGSTR